MSNSIVMPPDIEKKHEIYVVAHRGANAECPENTMKSFRRAVEIGADLIEMDVHKTSDGKIVVIHDSTTGRVGDRNLNVSETEYSVLKEVDVGEGEHIPLLSEVFGEFAGKIGFCVEIKQKGIAADVYGLMKEYGVIGSVLIISFIHDEISAIKKLDGSVVCATLEPTAKGMLGVILSRGKMINNAEKVGANGIHPFYKLVNPKFVKAAHSRGLFVDPWTVDSESAWKKMLNAGVDGITTNNPRGLIKFLKENSAP